MKQFLNPVERKYGRRRRAGSASFPEGNRFGFLTLTILLMILVRPFLEGWIGVGLLTDLFFLGIFLSGIYAARGEKYRYRFALLLAGAGLSARVTRQFHASTVLNVLAESLGALFFAQALWNIGAHLRAERQVTRDLIFAGVCGYLLLGLVWAYAYFFLNKCSPAGSRRPGPWIAICGLSSTIASSP